MLEVVDGERYGGIAKGGATIPAKMGCVRASGEKLDVFVKCSWAQCPPGGLVRELVGCLLASRLGLIVGTPVLVNLSDELIATVRSISPECSARMRMSVKPVFGSTMLEPGYVICDGVHQYNTALSHAAVEVWAFDQLIINVDRNVRKPNCLTKGNSLAIIDHEKSLITAGVGSLSPAPWQGKWKADTNHLFHELIHHEDRALKRLHDRWLQVDSAMIDEILDYVPDTWGSPDVVHGIRGYLIDLHRNLDAAFENLRVA